MNSFIISTDSGCDLPLSYCRNHGIPVLRMQYEMDGQSFAETIQDEDLSVFYRKMAQGASVHTSAINVEEYLSFWEPLLGQPVVHIAMGSGISSSYQNAMLARTVLLERHPDAELHVIDSLGACMAYGMQVVEAVQQRENGVSAAACTDKLSDFRHHCNAIYTTGDLEYLYKGGRVSRAGMFISRTLNIWPVLNLNDKGELRVIDKCRGKSRAYRRVCEIIADTAISPEQQTLFVCHSDAPEAAAEFAAQIRQTCGFREVVCSQIGTTIGAHTGPGLVTAFFYGKPRLPG